MVSIETVAAGMGFSPELSLALEQACMRFGINTELRVCHFLAQVAHESGTGRWLKELWGPTPAQSRYEGREDLGNTQPGDGFRFRGRGGIQLTGRDNYQRYSQAIYGDDRAVRNPDMVATLPDAALAAGYFWHRDGINAVADRDDVLAVSRAVNLGSPKSKAMPNGLDDRKAKLKLAKAQYARMVGR
jgi:putative chitinase